MYNARRHRARGSVHDAAMAVGFFDLFFDDDYRQRSDINDLRDQEWRIATDVAGLSAQVEKLQGQLHDLSMTVAVLLKMLGEAGTVDPKIVRYRVEAEIEELEARREEAAKNHQGSTVPVTCAKCGASVPANRTTITERGTICDRCTS
jgi:hypothetical protein